MPPKHSRKVTKRGSNAKSSSSISSSTSTLTALKPQATLQSVSASTILRTMDVNLLSEGGGKPAEEPVYFWKPDQENGYLGQWYKSEFEVDGCRYVTAEMWMMVQKAKLFGDEAVAGQMLQITDPKTHKSLGRQVSNFDDKIWNKERYRIVVDGTYYKFTTCKNSEELKTWLLETGNRELVEASPLDRIWGVGFGEKNAGKNRDRWGLNLLGKALMEVRGRLREEQDLRDKK